MQGEAYCFVLSSQKFSVQFMTPNLHLLLCQLKKQCLEVGETVGQQEYWVERIIKKFKQAVVNRSTKDPEKVLVNVLAIEYAYRSIPRKNTGTSGKQVVSFETGISCLGNGRAVGMEFENHACVIECVQSYVDSCGLESWDPTNLESVEVTQFDRMVFHGKTFSASTYTRQESRDDSHVAIHMGTKENRQVVIAQITALYRVTQPPFCTVPFHVMEVVAYHQPECLHDNDLGVIYKAKDLESYGPWYHRCIRITSNDVIIRKLVYTQNSDGYKLLMEYGCVHDDDE